MPTLKPWRENFVMIYHHRGALNFYRKPVQTVLSNLALLHNIDCKIQHGVQFFGESNSGILEDEAAIPSDVVYFRSTPQTSMTRKEFCALVQIALARCSNQLLDFDYGFQMQKALKYYPFPL